MDFVAQVHHIPVVGETILSSSFARIPGGKGANQAVAVARLGGTTAFVARVGDDGFGRQSIALLKEEGIDTRHVLLTEGVATGVAMIPVDCRGENSIIVASGANALLTPADIHAAADTIREAGIVLMQLETPVDTLIRAARLAREGGALVVLNPAPFPKEPLPAELLALVDIITPNETEASMMAGISVTDEASALQAILKIQATGIKQVILTAGSKGAYTAESGSLVNIPAVKTEVVDTTAAGDTFCGALCVALSEGNGLTGAIRFANRAAALSVTRRGAWMSIPKRGEID